MTKRRDGEILGIGDDIQFSDVPVAYDDNGRLRGAGGLEAAGAKWIVKLSATQDAVALNDYLDTQIDRVLCECVEQEH
ncbi:MAG: hypothetical protein LBL45_10165 [Treponema sp.]|nr:hypothetical protein [Treponema sp.]